MTYQHIDAAVISDLNKIADVLQRNADFHRARDRMNSELHLAKEVRYSPLTSETEAAYDRIMNLIGE